MGRTLDHISVNRAQNGYILRAVWLDQPMAELHIAKDDGELFQIMTLLLAHTTQAQQ